MSSYLPEFFNFRKPFFAIFTQKCTWAWRVCVRNVKKACTSWGYSREADKKKVTQKLLYSFLRFQRKFNFVQRVQELFFLKLSNCCTFQFGVFPVDSGCNPEYVKCAFGVPRATPCDLGNNNVHLGSKIFTTPILVK